MKKIFFILLIIYILLPANISSDTSKDNIDDAYKQNIKYINQNILLLKYQFSKEKASIDKIKQSFKRANEYAWKLKHANFRLSDDLAFKYGLIIDKYARKNNLDPNIIIAIIIVESSVRYDIVSDKGAMGLMQVRLCIWSKVFNINKQDLFDPETNIRIGTNILKRYIKRYKSVIKAITAYNHGRDVGANKYTLKIFDTYWWLKYGKIL